MKYTPVIGLEVHVQLNTVTKLFCRCLNEYAPEDPNKNICPFCTAQPGALPLLNQEAVKKAIVLGSAVGADIPEKTRWDRKNYFYPDLPSGYQISQYDNPIVEGGEMDFFIENKQTGEYTKSKVQLTRAHLESDAAKLLHVGGKTMVDFNRAGAPLIEVVTEPVIRSAEQAMAFVSELQLLARKLGISEADMDKGHMRFDCNVSLQNEEQFKSGTLANYRVETKNINSTRSLGRSIEYEIKRQTKLLNKNIIPDQETRGWKDDENKSVTQRSKEDAMDYRYFPEPDLQILEISKSEIPDMSNFPGLPRIQRNKYLDIGLSPQIANTYVNQEQTGELFEECLNIVDDKDFKLIKSISNIITGDLLAISNEKEMDISNLVEPKEIVELATKFNNGDINNKGLNKAINVLSGDQKLSIDQVLKEHNLIQMNDGSALEDVAKQVIVENPKPVEQFKDGKEQVIGFLVGQCMKTSKGQGNPQKFKDILTSKLRDE